MGLLRTFTASMKVFIVLALAFAAASARGVGSRIVGGTEVSFPGKYPWQASIEPIGGSHQCGASMISNRWLVTAAHCVGAGASGLAIVMGMHDRFWRWDGDARTYYLNSIQAPRLEQRRFPGLPQRHRCDADLLLHQDQPVHLRHPDGQPGPGLHRR